MKYIFAIDETVNFSFDEKPSSFVCGVLISKSEGEIKKQYQKTYAEFYPQRSAPQCTAELIGKEQENFHYNKLNSSQKEICKKYLASLVDEVFISTGKPLLFANNQNYWQIAVTAVITQLLKHQKFEKDDVVEIQIDYRADKVWGTLNESNPDFLSYHNILKNQFGQLLKPYQKSLQLQINTIFVSDTKSFYVNLADIVCGLVRDKKLNPNEQCPCEKVMGSINPAAILHTQPLAALVGIFQELLTDGNSNNMALIKNILEKCRKDESLYFQVWESFYSFLKFQIKQRFQSDSFSKLYETNQLFLNEFKQHYPKINSEKSLELITLFIEYASHNGEIVLPFEPDFFLQILNADTQESRLLRKWEKNISYELRVAQILFNAYEFDTLENRFETLWEQQEKIINTIPFSNPKDENTTAIIGTLAQSYAYKGNIDKAIEYFELSLTYSAKSKAQTYFYLLSCYLEKQEIEKVYHYFELQTSVTPEKFATQNAKDIWGQLSYNKLRALEIYKKGSSTLPELITPVTENTFYPYPLVLKWQGVALMLENLNGNKEKIKELLLAALAALLQEQNGFTLKTLSLPIIQLFALVDNSNPYHAAYNRYLNEWTRQSEPFKVLIKKSAILGDIKNEKSIWERAMALPFIYS